MTSSMLTCRIDNETATHIPSDTHDLGTYTCPYIDELVPVGWTLLCQTLQTHGGGRGDADQSPPNSALLFSMYNSVLSLSLPHNKHTHTHRPSTVTLAAHACRGLIKCMGGRISCNCVI